MVARRRFKWNTVEDIVLKWKYAFDWINDMADHSKNKINFKEMK